VKKKPVILVVDDKSQNIELLEALLVPQGYEIVSATSGREALEKLGTHTDLILLDVMMPVWTVLKSPEWSGRTVPVVCFR
jgi:CheY-like chemotaxis protein